MDGRSIWTGKHGTGLEEIQLDGWPLLSRKRGEQRLLVEPEFESDLRDFVAYARSKRKAFWAWLVIGTTLCLAGAFLSIEWPIALWAVAAGLLVLGAMILAYPFATPETIRAVGVRPSRRLARLGAALILVMAAVTATSAAMRDIPQVTEPR